MCRLLVLVGLLACPAVVEATTLSTVAIEHLFAAADHVAVVEVIDSTPIVAATAVLGSDRPCGAISRGRVVHSLKGAHGNVLEFGYAMFYQPGQRHLLFLTRPGRVWQDLLSTNGAIINAEREYRRACAAVLTANEVMQLGVGALPIERPAVFGGDWAVRLPHEDVSIPIGLPCREADAPPYSGGRHFLWVPEARLVDLLRSLGPRLPSVEEAAPSLSATVRVYNTLPFEAVVYARVHSGSTCMTTPEVLKQQRPQRAEMVLVEPGREATLTIHILWARMLVWSIRPATAVDVICEDAADIARGRELRIELTAGNCAAR